MSSKVEFNKPLYNQVRRLGQIRRKHASLRKGTFEPVLADEEKGVLGFWRKHGGDETFILLNLNAKDVEFEFESPWEIGKKVKDEVADSTFKVKEDTITVTIKKRASVVLVRD